METLVGQLDKKDPVFIVENDGSRKYLPQRTDDARSNLLQPIGKYFPDL
jgi:hypothetical protein